MLFWKIAPVLVLALATRAEKKIELLDIEDDNLKSEKEKDISEGRQHTTTGLVPLDFLKNGIFKYFEGQNQTPQQARYVHQYAVTEPPEKPTIETPKSASPSSATQQAMVGYLSNVPMQIYLVPQYYGDQNEAAPSAQPTAQYVAPSASRVSSYPSPELNQAQPNYIDLSSYAGSKSYIQQYTQPLAYYTYSPQTMLAAAQATVSPVFTYQMPLVQYATALQAPPVVPKTYYQTSIQNDGILDDENEVDSSKQYPTQSEPPYMRPSGPDFPRYYNSRAPIREDHRIGTVSELPPPHPLLLKGHQPHLSHLPKALPIHRPLNKPVYAAAGSYISNAYTPRPNEPYPIPLKRRPNSLLESYIPSRVQVDYLKRGFAKDPISAYEALSSGRAFAHPPIMPRQFERGFLPNQMYHTAAGGITYGQLKRAAKADKRML